MRALRLSGVIDRILEGQMTPPYEAIRLDFKFDAPANDSVLCIFPPPPVRVLAETTIAAEG